MLTVSAPAATVHVVVRDKNDKDYQRHITDKRHTTAVLDDLLHLLRVPKLFQRVSGKARSTSAVVLPKSVSKYVINLGTNNAQTIS